MMKKASMDMTTVVNKARIRRLDKYASKAQAPADKFSTSWGRLWPHSDTRMLANRPATLNLRSGSETFQG